MYICVYLFTYMYAYRNMYTRLTLTRTWNQAMNLVIPLLTANAFDAVVPIFVSGVNSVTPEAIAAAKASVANTMIKVILLHTGANVLTSINMAITGTAGERIVARLRARLYGHVLAQELGFFDHRKTGEIVSRLGSDTQLVEKACSQHLTESVNGFLKVLACFGFMFFIR